MNSRSYSLVITFILVLALAKHSADIIKAFHFFIISFTAIVKTVQQN